MDEVKNGIREVQSLPDNIERLVKIDIKDSGTSATLYADPKGSNVKQRLDNLENRFNNLKTINNEELYGPGNIEIKQGESSSVTKSYVDTKDSSVLASSKSYTDSVVAKLRDYADKAASDALDQAKEYADSISGGISGGGNVILIDAVGRISSARSEAYKAYKDGKAIIIKCDTDKFIPMTVVSESSDSVDMKGFDVSYSGYGVTPNVTLVTTIWTLDSNGLNKVEKSIPINSCRTFDCTNNNTIANTFSNAISAYNEGLSVILKVDQNTFVLANSINNSSLTGYSFAFNAGTLSDGQSGIVSVDIIRWRLTNSGLSKDTFNAGQGGSGSGGSVTLKQYYSTNTVSSGIPQNPDDNPVFWNQTSQTSSSVWAAMKSTGNDWVIWKLQPKDGTNGNGISNLTKRYGVSDSASVKPTSWTSTMPNAKQGQYIWCEITISYTIGAAPDVYYTISYIGKDGVDGSDGTSVNILNTLPSKEDLPTSGNNNGDGYLINGDLWVYNGNAITSDITYRGFTNVGKIQGPTGKTPCVHIAWCNGDPANGDYTGFDTDAPDGSLFDYMGTYVDYKDSPEAVCPDPTEPSLYTWTKIKGADGMSAIQVDLTCESDEVALTHDGKAASTGSIVTYVGMFEGRESIDLTDISYKAPSGINVTTSLTGGQTGYPGVITVNVTKDSTAIKEGSNRIELTISGKCLDGKTVHQSRIDYIIIGVKAGQPGEDATTYELDVTPDVVKKYKDGSFDSDNVSCCLYKTVGSTRSVSTDGRMTYSIDGKPEVSVVNNYGISTGNITNRIEFKFYLNDILRLSRKVVVVADGATGESPKIVNTTYQYAVSMSFTKTPDDLTAWTDEPIEVEPGQYLYIKTIHEWSNGETTYDFSWVRSGLNGYSNLPFVSTVFKRSDITPNAPIGGDYLNPTPDGWTDGITSGSERLWMSTRRFTADGLAPQDSEWSTPVSALSSVDMNIRYSSAVECPKDPDTAASGVWNITPSEDSIWGAFQPIIDSVKKSWEIRKIKGEGSVIDNTSAATPFVGEWTSTGLYYGNKNRTDIVRVTGQSGSSQEETYYYIANKAKNFDGVTTPKPGTTAGDSYWLRFGANFDNIATGILFSEKIISEMINAINLSADKIDAGAINTDDLVAKVVRTSESGERVVIEKDVLTAYDVNGNKTLVVDSGVQVGDSLAEDNKYFKVPARITAYSRSFTANTSSVNSNTKSYTIGQVVIPDSDYSYVLTTSKLRIGLRYGWTGNTPINVNVTNIVSVDIYATIGSNKMLIGSGALQSTGADDGSIRFITIKPYVRSVGVSGTVTFTMEVTHRASISGSTTSTHNVYVDLFELSVFCALLNNGVVISDAISMGAVDDDTHCMIGAGYDGNYAVFDAVASGNGIKVRNDGVILTDYEYGDRRLIAPYMVDIRTTGNKLSMKDAMILSKCYDAGIPAYIKGSIQIDSQLVTYLAQIKCVNDTSWTTNTVNRTFFASCDAHKMTSSSWSDTTDYRINVFFYTTIYNTYLIESASDTKNISVTQYLHTV